MRIYINNHEYQYFVYFNNFIKWYKVIETENKMLIFEKLIFLTSLLTVLLCVFGIIGNILSIKICSKKELRKTPTFIFMSFISAINILKLLTIMIFILILQFFVTNIYKLNSLFLNICFFLIFWKYQSSVYLMVRLNLWLFKLWS